MTESRSVFGDGDARGMDNKGTWGRFEGEGKIHYLACGDSFMGVYTCQNSPKCTLQRWAIYCMPVVHQLSCKKIYMHLLYNLKATEKYNKKTKKVQVYWPLNMRQAVCKTPCMY